MSGLSTKYGKPFRVTEFANWHSQNDGAQITTLAEQETQMTEMVATCEGRDDIYRYALFTGRASGNPHYTNLLAGPGQLTGLGNFIFLCRIDSKRRVDRARC